MVLANKENKHHMTSRKSILIALAVALMAVVSCGTVKDIAYFQNKVVNQPEAIDKHAGIVIQPKDMLSIVVSSRNPELVAMFNLPVISYQAGSDEAREYQIGLAITKLKEFYFFKKK